MQKLTLPAVSALGVLLLSASPAGATVAKALDVETLARRAAIIVRGSTLESTAEWTRGGKLVQTTTRVRVGSLLKGIAPEEVVEVRTPGGTIGDITQRVSGVAQLTAGEEVVLFLRRLPVARARFAIEGFSQGKFTLKRVEGRTLVTREVSGLKVLESDGEIRAAPSFEPVPEAQFVERVRRALAEKDVP